MADAQFSSFQIAKMLNVSRQAVNQWIDKGYMTSYRTPGGHRRVLRQDLLQFLASRGIPIPNDLRSSTVRFSEDGPPAPEIVLLDDNTDFLTLMRRALLDRLPLAQIRKFTNGLDCLIAIGAAPPDLLVLDLVMPNIDGLEVCHRLKSNPVTEGLPILVVTAYDSQQNADKLNALTVDRIFPKSSPLLEVADQIARFARSLAKIAT